MKALLDKIIANKKNQKVLQYLDLMTKKELLPYFKTCKESFSGFDEGGAIFFFDYGEAIPDDCKFSLYLYSIMINKDTGEIFAFNKGRFSIFFKYDFIKAGIENNDDLKRGHSFDCITDITALGDNWCFMDDFDDPQEQLQWSYELTKTAPDYL